MKKISGDLDRDPIKPALGARRQRRLLRRAGSRIAERLLRAGRGGAAKVVTSGTHILTLDSLSRDLVAAGTETDPDHPQDVVKYSLKGPAQVSRLTDVNADLLAGKQLAKTEEIWYSSSGNTKVHGWIVKPPSFDPAKKYPLILEIHGGPFSMYSVAFNYMFQNFAANNFVVLYTNPRGSTGYGGAFSDGIDHNYPGPDYDDLMAGVDAVTGQGLRRPGADVRLGLQRRRRAFELGDRPHQPLRGRGRALPGHRLAQFRRADRHPALHLQLLRQAVLGGSAAVAAALVLMHVGNVTTPTLLMTGVLDRRTPMPQTEEYYAALKMRGVPAALLQFNDEFHGTASKPSNFIRTQLYMMAWFNKYTRAAGGKITTTDVQ
jgi:dipeptidyl aminopeptidase/acylaminoacyl peptidase